MKYRADSVLRLLLLSVFGSLLLSFLHHLPHPDEVYPKQQALIVTSFDGNYRFIGANFLCNLRRLGLQNRTVIVALEPKVETFVRRHYPDYTVINLASLGVSLIPYQSPISNQVHTSGSLPFARASQAKLEAAAGIMNRFPGRDVVVTDPDVTWCRDASSLEVWKPSLTRKQVDLHFGSDWAPEDLSSALFYARNSAAVRRFFMDVKDSVGSDDLNILKTGLCEYKGARITSTGCVSQKGITAVVVSDQVICHGRTKAATGELLTDRNQTAFAKNCNVNGRLATLHWNGIDGPFKSGWMKHAGVWYVNETRLLRHEAGEAAGDSEDLCLSEPAKP